MASSPLADSKIDGPSLYRGSCYVLQQAVLSKACQVVIALHYLSSAGSTITSVLPSSTHSHEPPVPHSISSEVNSLERTLSLSFETEFTSRSQAQRCLHGTSTYSMLTALHLMRCPDQPHLSCQPKQGTLAALTSKIYQDRAWCATTVAQLSAWLLTQWENGPDSEKILRHALDVSPQPYVVGSLRSAGHDAGHGAAPLVEGHRVCFVSSSLLQVFPELGVDPQVPDVSKGPAAIDISGGCRHRWMRQRLPEWLLDTTLGESAIMWYQGTLQQRAFRKLRLAHGFRVLARLSEGSYVGVASQLGAFDRLARPSEAMPNRSEPAATPTRCPSSVNWEREENYALRELEDSGLSGDVSSIHGGQVPSVPTDAVETEDPASAPLTDALVVLTVEPVHLVLEDRSPPSAEVETASGSPSAAATTAGKKLGTVLPSAGADSIEEDGAETSSGEVLARTLVQASDRALSFVDSSFEIHPSTSRGHWTQTATARQSLARFVHRKRKANVAQCFLFWRDRRFYTAVANRYVEALQLEHLRARTFNSWRDGVGRRIQQRQAERNELVCSNWVAEQERRRMSLRLRIWRDAAVCRRFTMHTVGLRVFCAWRYATTSCVYARRRRQGPVQWEVGLLKATFAHWRGRFTSVRADTFHEKSTGAYVLAVWKSKVLESSHTRQIQARSIALCLSHVIRVWHRSLMSRRRMCEWLLKVHRHSHRSVFTRWVNQLKYRRFLTSQEVSRGAARACSLRRHCFFTWRCMYRLRTTLTLAVGRQQRHRMQSVWTRWSSQTALCRKWHLDEEQRSECIYRDLLIKRCSRLWIRRYTESAARRLAASQQRLEAQADQRRTLELSACAFFRWRAKVHLLIHNNVDTRRAIPAIAMLLQGVITGHDHSVASPSQEEHGLSPSHTHDDEPPRPREAAYTPTVIGRRTKDRVSPGGLVVTAPPRFSQGPVSQTSRSGGKPANRRGKQEAPGATQSDNCAVAGPAPPQPHYYTTVSRSGLGVDRLLLKWQMKPQHHRFAQRAPVPVSCVPVATAAGAPQSAEVSAMIADVSEIHAPAGGTLDGLNISGKSTTSLCLDRESSISLETARENLLDTMADSMTKLLQARRHPLDRPARVSSGNPVPHGVQHAT